jgi:hypothetical protein
VFRQSDKAPKCSFNRNSKHFSQKPSWKRYVPRQSDKQKPNALRCSLKRQDSVSKHSSLKLSWKR